MSVADPVQVIRANLADWEVPHVELAIFGSADPSVIAAAIDGFCRRHLESAVRGYHFQTSSVGSTHGLRLDDGRDVVLKVRPPVAENPHLHMDVPALARLVEILRWLHARGYPCPEPLLGPQPLGRGLATVEALVDRGARGNGFEPACRKEIARAYAEQLELLRAQPFDASALKHFWRGEALYPQPHSKLFDFDKPARLAPVVDDLARRARSMEDHGAERVLGHGDWRIEHLRFDAGRVSATYDWDSLLSSAETDLLGVVVHGFTADWSVEGARRLPGREDILAFVADYEQARGASFTKRERRSLLARCVYTIAYGARCAMSGDLERVDWAPDTWPHLLLSEGERLLSG